MIKKARKMTRKILVVDDDSHIREVIVFTLEKAGMQAIQAANGLEALQSAADHNPDLIVLDISMPEMDGLEACKSLRKKSETPILFLSSRDEEIDKIVGLEIGGDDYMTKPFSPRELVARINAILKRSAAQFPPSAETKMSHGAVKIDNASYTAAVGAHQIPLTATEFMLLLALFKYPNKVYTRDELMDQVYGVNITVSDRTIDSHIRRIRSKFAEKNIHDVISTNHGIGYKLGSCQ